MVNTCIVQGCVRPRKGRGLCGAHYVAARRAGVAVPPLPRPSVAERLAASSEPKGGCVVWTGAVSASGYGVITIRDHRGRVSESVHRAAYVLAHGEIPEGGHVCHACDVRVCINPDHLWVGTSKDNALDMARKGRAPRTVLTVHEVRAIRWMYACTQLSMAAIGRRFGVTKACVGSVVTGRTHVHVSGPRHTGNGSVSALNARPSLSEASSA